jgi:hypothetical protein
MTRGRNPTDPRDSEAAELAAALQRDHDITQRTAIGLAARKLGIVGKTRKAIIRRIEVAMQGRGFGILKAAESMRTAIIRIYDQKFSTQTRAKPSVSIKVIRADGKTEDHGTIE